MKKVVRGFTGLWIALLMVAALAAGASTVHGWQPPSSQEGFVPVDNLPQKEQLPAAPLVIAAYAVAWVAVLGYLWSIWSRLTRVERDIADVSRRVEAGSRR